MKRSMVRIGVGRLAVIVVSLAASLGVVGQTVIDLAVPQHPVRGGGYDLNDNIVTITGSGGYVLTGSTTYYRVVVAKDVVADITLRNASIASDMGSPLALASEGCEVRLQLEGSNRLSASVPDTEGEDRFSAGLQVEGVARLTIAGSGSLVVTGSMAAAGIGGGCIEHAGGDITVLPTGTITINGGSITSQAGFLGAGIGGGAYADGGVITINGGKVIANGGVGGTGIGGGWHGNGGTINITGGSVAGFGLVNSAIDMAGNPAGIGGGGSGGQAGSISITGGAVYAYSSSGTSIGGGENSTGGSIRITGGIVMGNKIGIGTGGAVTPTTVTGGAILVGSINATAFGNAMVQTGFSVGESFLRNLAVHTPAGETMTRWTHDTIRHEQTIQVPDSIGYAHDTMLLIIRLPDTIIHVTLREWNGETVYADTLWQRDTLRLVVRDTFWLRDTMWRDSLELRDTTIIRQSGTRVDTLYLLQPINDTLYITVHDTIEVPTPSGPPVIVHDTVDLIATETRFVILTLQGDNDTTLATPTGALTPDVYALAPYTDYVLYDLAGRVVARGQTDGFGRAALPPLGVAPQVYVFYNNGRYWKWTYGQR